MKQYFKTLEELKSFTSIDLSSKSSQEIVEYVNNYKENNEDLGIEFPIKEGFLIRKVSNDDDDIKDDIFQNLLEHYYFKIEKNDDSIVFHIETYYDVTMMGEKVFVGESATKFIIGENTDISNNSIIPLDYIDRSEGKFNAVLQAFRNNKIDKKTRMNNIGYVITGLLYINCIRKNRDTIYKKTKGMRFKSSNNKSKTAQTEKVEILNNDKVMYVINGEKKKIDSFRTYERKTDSWNVMGHFRHYKSGLIKWIEGYKKGIGKSKAKHYKVK